MPTLMPKQLAILTARAGVARSGAVRSGFVPTGTVGLTPGTAGPFVPAKKGIFPLPAPSWTRIK